MPGEAIVTELRQQLEDCQVQAGRMLKQAKEEADKTHLEEMTRLELRHDQVCSRGAKLHAVLPDCKNIQAWIFKSHNSLARGSKPSNRA